MTLEVLKPSKIYDMDGTLMECGIYYDACLKQGGEFLAAQFGTDASLAEHVIRELDLAAVKMPGQGWGRDRFPRSFAAAARALGCLYDAYGAVVDNAAEAMWAIGDSVFDAEYALFEGVREQLRRDRAAGWQLILYTKGDREVQQLKIDKQQLAQYFDAIHIVDRKNSDVLRGIIGEHQVDIMSSWMIGDSKKDDIAPAQALGVNTALIDSGNHWSYNHEAIDPPTLHVKSVVEVPTELGLYECGMLRKRHAA